MPTAKAGRRSQPAGGTSGTPGKAERELARDLLAFIDASPSPWHAVASASARLAGAGFEALDEADEWRLRPGGSYFVVRGGSSLVAFIVGQGSLPDDGLHLIGAHTDSPGLRLKPRAAHAADGMVRLGVEIYGGPILATFADRDLGLAGRVAFRKGKKAESRLLRTAGPVARLPNLAIHMNRDVNEAGLKFNKQTELPLIFSRGTDDSDPSGFFACFLGHELGVDPQSILSWDIAAFDVQPGALWGPAEEFVASRQLDNLASCHAGLESLLSANKPKVTAVLALFDHEEVGSSSAVGADGSFLADVVARLAESQGIGSSGRRRMLARSFGISADMAHAWQPNFPAAYEPAHRVLVNGGPVIKSNASQRYSSRADTAAQFMLLCAEAGVTCQQYAHRTDLGCGSTIGPMLAANLGVPVVDVGCPMWAMHSARESAGVIDHAAMVAVMRRFLR